MATGVGVPLTTAMSESPCFRTCPSIGGKPCACCWTLNSNRSLRNLVNLGTADSFPMGAKIWRGGEYFCSRSGVSLRRVYVGGSPISMGGLYNLLFFLVVLVFLSGTALVFLMR